MKFLQDVLSREDDYRSLLDAVTKSHLPLAASGLSQIHKSLVATALAKHTGRKMIILTHDEAAAVSVSDDMRQFGANAVMLPQRDYNLARMTGYSREYEHKRTKTLSEVIDGAFDALILSVDAAVQYTVPPEILKKNLITVKSDSTVDTKALTETLISAGYKRCELTDGVGKFSIRGGIIDIFPTNCEKPVRIELWGDEVDSISEFDIETQRRTESISEVRIFPACELPYDPIKLASTLESYLEKEKKLSTAQKQNIVGDTELLRSGISVSPDLYIPFLYDKPATVFDYFDNPLTLVFESGNINERLKSMLIRETEDIKILLESGTLCPAAANLWLQKTELYSHLDSAVFIESFPRASYDFEPKELIGFNFKRSTPWSGDISVLKEDIEFTLRLGGCAVILAGESKAADVLTAELNDSGVSAIRADADKPVPEKGVFVMTGGLSGGFEIPSLNFILITHRHISSDTVRKKKRPKYAREISSLDELHKGDYVVHSAHGIGIFDGIKQLTHSGITKDYIKINYKGTDVLYTPVIQLDLVSKYIGSANSESIKVNRLGGAEWQKTRSRVKAAVKNMAKQLTALYAKRMAAKGYAFSVDTDLQNNFERRFEYDETDDQLRCINEIKNDMERAMPMDRLLCGDVGFGKTEVALRAAFKCVSEGKQCALLVPTTILAMQHYNTIMRRFGDMPVNVRLLSRFVPPKKQQQTVLDLKKGRVDLVVGTHRLISKDIQFKDLGLAIIDEEQRFGVAQKERLKELYPTVDILTLSATPIPRTLNMAMSGLRDMSTIDEAPGDRHPVQTYVLEQNDGVLTDAINKELRRGGQVYYLHNRVESIELCAARLKERIPDARFAVAHGKMTEEELSDVWSSLVEHEIDVLVCTTIIETGVDVPNVNTLIIENADRMGLSQLHQLRGRVGRSPRRAYAYFCYKRGRELSDIAAKRLEAIREFTEFGSGFKIALRDLEIRGAGSILGGEQHGNMEAVGYDMYLKLLSDAVNEENGVKSHEDFICTVDLKISAHIPESYIESLPARLGIYKRIADINDESDVSDITDELCDRFGEPPKAVMGLIEISLLRTKAANAGITEITETPTGVILHTSSLNNEVAAKLSAAFGEYFRVSVKDAPLYVIRLKPGEKPSAIVSRIVKVL